MHMQMSYYGHTYQVPVLSFLAPHQGASSLTLPPTVAQNFELHNAFAHIIAHQLAGQNVHVTVRDCAAAGGYCALNVVGMNAWLADHLYFDCTVSAFFYPNHGKMLVSRASQPCPGRATRSTLATLLRDEPFRWMGSGRLLVAAAWLLERAPDFGGAALAPVKTCG